MHTQNWPCHTPFKNMSPQCPQDKIMSCKTLPREEPVCLSCSHFSIPHLSLHSKSITLNPLWFHSWARSLSPSAFVHTAAFIPVQFLPNPSHISIKMIAIHPSGLNLSSKIYSMTSPKTSTTILNKICWLLTCCVYLNSESILLHSVLLCWSWNSENQNSLSSSLSWLCQQEGVYIRGRWKNERERRGWLPVAIGLALPMVISSSCQLLAATLEQVP